MWIQQSLNKQIGMQAMNVSDYENLLDLFSNVTSRCIVDFIKEIGFHRRI